MSKDNSKNIYKVELKDTDGVMYFNNSLKLSDIYGILVKYIHYKELFPSAIINDVKSNGMASCWCGSIGYGYDIRISE